jgi:ABC-type transporter Mla subunit MlaD
MNKNQINRKEMYDTVIAFLDTHAEKWSSIPKVGEFKNKFSTIVVQIEQAQGAQQDAQVFLGKNKKQLKSTVAQKADILNDSIEAFALVTGNQKLAGKMATSYSDLNRMRNTDFIPVVKEIISEAEANAEILQTEYGVTAEQIDGLKNDLDDFLAINGQPRAYKIASVQATKDLEQLFSEATDTLGKKLDKVMKIFQRRDASFYNGYLAAREIVDN